VLRRYLLILALFLNAPVCGAQSEQLQNGSDASAGPVRLESVEGANSSDNEAGARTPKAPNTAARQREEPQEKVHEQTTYQPGEFELFVQRLVANTPDAGSDQARLDTGAKPHHASSIRKFGADLMLPRDDASVQVANPLVPSDYLLNPGDELTVTMWGAVDAQLRVTIDRAGRITIPRVGPVMLAGVRFADAPSVIRRHVAEVFKNFDLSVSLGQLRGIRVYVTGYVTHPGAYNVSSLSTVMQALLRAGGPSAAGSFRNIELRRPGQSPVMFDLYDFLLRGDRNADRTLMAGDVINVGPVGPLVAVIGSVNKQAIFELKPGESVGDALRMAGGFDAVADRTRVALERLTERTTIRVAEVHLPEGERLPLSQGDVVHAFSAIDLASPIQRQAKRVRIEGEVAKPGEYVLPAGSGIVDALSAAGGITASAYVFGTEFTRESVRLTQQQNYDRALRDLQTEFTKATATQRATTADEATAQQARATNTTRLIEQLRAVRPTGRIVLQLPSDSGQLPNLALEDGDRIYIPPRPSTVGVFGSVFNGGSYLYGDGKDLSDYLRLAGGPTRGADTSSTFVLRANGSVISGRQFSGWFGNSNIEDVRALPGDTIFVPEEVDKSTFIQNAKDWTQILSQFGLGVAALKTLR
jgi:protein involved in polysaccharide export with SLBB domain